MVVEYIVDTSDDEPGVGQAALNRRADSSFRSWGAGLFAILMMAVLMVTVIFAFLNVGGETWESAKQLLTLLLPIETGLIGVAVGFYFGSGN